MEDPANIVGDTCSICRVVWVPDGVEVCSVCRDKVSEEEAKQAELNDIDRGYELHGEGRPISDCENAAQRRGWVEAELRSCD